MKFFYASFIEYKNLDQKIKENYLFLATSYTTPIYWNGQSFQQFVPSKQLFYDACKNFQQSDFENRYIKQIYSLNKKQIVSKLQKLSIGKDIIFLVWQSEQKESQRDIFIPWLTNTSIKDIKAFSFLKNLQIIKNKNQHSILFNL